MSSILDKLNELASLIKDKDEETEEVFDEDEIDEVEGKIDENEDIIASWEDISDLFYMQVTIQKQKEVFGDTALRYEIFRKRALILLEKREMEIKESIGSLEKLYNIGEGEEMILIFAGEEENGIFKKR